MTILRSAPDGAGQNSGAHREQTDRIRTVSKGRARADMILRMFPACPGAAAHPAEALPAEQTDALPGIRHKTEQEIHAGIIKEIHAIK